MSENRYSDNFFGRGSEMELLQSMAADCLGGKGKLAIITGERGIGKTSLVERLRCSIDDNGATFLSAGTIQDSAHPFILFSHALPDWNGLFRDTEHTSFSQIFAVNRSGLLVAHASSGLDEMDADIIAGMLSAVQNFVHDSFDSPGNTGSGLGKLEYGDMKILIEHGENMFLTGVFRGNEHGDMAPLLKRTMERIEREHGSLIAEWSGRVEDMVPISDMVAALARQRFLVKRDLEGVKLSNERVKIADAVLDILAAKASSKPVVLMLEDLQWADESSLFVLDYLSRNIVALPIFILCTARSGENEFLDGVVESMAEQGFATCVALRGLDDGEISSLVSVVCSPNDFTGDFIRDIGQRCSGNPLFVIEMMRQMLEDGQIFRADECFSLLEGGYRVPESIEEIVQSRLEMLEPDAMMLCECASCMGRVFETGAVMSLEFLAGRETAFSKAEARGVLFRGETISNFAHAIYPEIIYRDIGSKWKNAYHRSLGRYFETAHAGDTEPVLYELAKHFSRCGDSEKAAIYCTKAGEKAETVFATRDAIEFYRNAADALKKQTGTEAGARAAAIAERLGDIHTLVGRTKEAEAAFMEALADETGSEARARLHRKCSIALMKRGDFQAAVKEAEMGLAEANGIEYRRLKIQMASIWMMTGEFSKAIEAAKEIIAELSDVKGAETELGNCHNLMATSHWYQGNGAAALEHHEKALGFRRAAGELRRIAITLNNIGVVHHASGNLEKAMEYYEESMAMWEKTGDVDGMSGSYGNIGIIRWNRGELDAALKLFHKARRISESIGDNPGMVTAYGNISMTQRDMGELDASLEYGKKALDIALAMGDKISLARAMTNMAGHMEEAGVPEEAIEHYAEAEAIFREAGAAEMLADILLAHAATLSEIGRKDESERILSEAEALLKDGGGALHLAKGRVHLSTGDYDKALELLDKALEIFRKGDARSVPKIINYRAAALDGLGRSEEAAASYREALQMFEKMGMKARAEKCAESLGT